SDAYRERRGDVTRQASALVDAIRVSGQTEPSREPLTSGILAEAVRALRAQLDQEWGGFGGAPKFPPASVLEFLLRRDEVDPVRKTLDGMAAGGMYDLVGGGFHRYSVDRRWLVPHFEKMLYDNALLAPVYLHAWVVTGEERYRRVVEQTLEYVLRELRLPEGQLTSSRPLSKPPSSCSARSPATTGASSEPTAPAARREPATSRTTPTSRTGSTSCTWRPARRGGSSRRTGSRCSPSTSSPTRNAAASSSRRRTARRSSRARRTSTTTRRLPGTRCSPTSCSAWRASTATTSSSGGPSASSASCATRSLARRPRSGGCCAPSTST